MKIILLLLFLFQALLARENPFEPILSAPKVTEDIIPLLHITSKKTLTPPARQTAPKKLTTPAPIETHATCTIQSEPVQTIPIAPTIMIEKKPISVKRKKHTTKKRRYKTIYQNYFLKVQTNYKNFKIFTKDRLVKKVRYINPARMTFDFDRLQYFHTKNITFNKAFAKKIKFGSHHNFYRITVHLARYKQYKLTKKPYGYLLSFY